MPTDFKPLDITTADATPAYPKPDSLTPDNPLRRPADISRINLDEESEITYWTRELGESTEVLKAAIDEVGPEVVEVRKKLGK